MPSAIVAKLITPCGFRETEIPRSLHFLSSYQLISTYSAFRALLGAMGHKEIKGLVPALNTAGKYRT